jgi:aryl-alcohol dehydrogenase-like predicted oxidoreductase
VIARRGREALGFDVPLLGFGVSGPHGTALVPEALTQRLVRRAIDAGANLFDTAPFYGVAQQRLGRALKGVRRESVVLSSKAKDWSADGLRAHVETDLRQLGVEYLDLLFLHGPPGALGDEAMAALAEMKAQGKFRALGVCGRGEEIAAATAKGGFHAIMAPAFSTWAAFAAERNLAFFGIEALAGVSRPTRTPTRGDLWRTAKRVHKRLTKRPALPATLPPIRTADAALTAALAQKGVTSVIVTTTRRAHLDACLAIVSDRL